MRTLNLFIVESALNMYNRDIFQGYLPTVSTRRSFLPMKTGKLMEKCLFRSSVEKFCWEERIRRLFLSVCLFIILPSTVGFGIRDLMVSRVTEGTMSIVTGLFVIAVSLLLYRVGLYSIMVRFVAFCMSAWLLFELFYGGGNGTAFLWLLVLPAMILFFLGFSEGIIWVGSTIVWMAVMFFGNIGYEYPLDLKLRFIVVYILITFLSCCIEIMRERYFGQLISEKEALQKAIGEIQVLKGMVPICASCKKIRDDKGFWMQIEAYMKAHTDIEFSHGICPECAAKLYPTTRNVRRFENERMDERESKENVSG